MRPEAGREGVGQLASRGGPRVRSGAAAVAVAGRQWRAASAGEIAMSVFLHLQSMVLLLARRQVHDIRPSGTSCCCAG